MEQFEIFRFSNLWPAWAIVLFVIGASVLVFYNVFRLKISRKVKITLGFLRIVLVGVIIFCIFTPEIRTYIRSGEKNHLFVLLDTSESMSIGDAPGGKSRLQYAIEKVLKNKQLFEKLDLDFKTEVFLFSDSLIALNDKPGDIRADGECSKILEALYRIRSYIRKKGDCILLITDGAETEKENYHYLVKLLSLDKIPVYTFGVGSDQKIRDVAIKNIYAPAAVFIDSYFNIAADIGVNSGKAKEMNVSFYHGDILLDKKRIRVQSGKIATARISAKCNQSGANLFCVEIDSGEDERISWNNKQMFMVECRLRDSPIKVLYTEAYFKDKNLFADALESAGNVEVTTLASEIWLADRGIPHVLDPEKGFPRNPEEILQYDLIVLSDVKKRVFNNTQMNAMKKLVSEKGGGLLMVGGFFSFASGNYMESVIEDMLPVEIYGKDMKNRIRNRKGYITDDLYRMKVPEGALLHPIMRIVDNPLKNKMFWNEMPRLAGFNFVERLKPGATLLGYHPKYKGPDGNRVIMAVQPYGHGRTMAFMSDVTFGWGRFFNKWGRDDDNDYFVKFCVNAMNWLIANRLMKGKDPVRIKVEPHKNRARHSCL